MAKTTILDDSEALKGGFDLKDAIYIYTDGDSHTESGSILMNGGKQYIYTHHCILRFLVSNTRISFFFSDNPSTIQ